MFQEGGSNRANGELPNHHGAYYRFDQGSPGAGCRFAASLLSVVL
jgi:hypothetical protein